MRKYIAFLLLYSFYGFGQSGSVNNENPILNQTPPNPEAFKFATYGEVPVNESSGNATTTIPLHTFKAGKITVPISITHSGGAVKVDEMNTWTGINWQLSAGGVITRTVNDLVDENSNRRIYTSSQLNNLGQNITTIWELTSTTTDSEADMFYFNFNGFSGSFYLDENLKPKLAKYDKELKIELSDNPIVNGVLVFDKKTITITTPDGTKYYFGGVNASESTRSRSGNQHSIEDFAQTSFYLFKIENLVGDIINFNYQVPSNAAYDEKISVYQYLKKDYEVTSLTNGNCIPRTNQPPNLSDLISNFIQTKGKLFLKSIVSNRNSDSVVFNFSTNAITNRIVLNNIDINNSVFGGYKKIELEYLIPQNQNSYKRFFLEKIKTFYNSNTTTDEVYTFEYNNPELLPDRFALSQDYEGYYNGKTSNFSLIPIDLAHYFDYGDNFLGDRSAVFEKAIYGSLKKVTYPTKGFTKFEYETGIDNNKIVYGKETRELKVYHDKLDGNLREQLVQSSTTCDLTDFDGGCINRLNGTQPMNVKIYIKTIGALTQQNKIRFKLIHSAGTTIVKEYLIGNGGNNEEVVKNITEQFNNLLSTGFYTLQLEFLPYALNNNEYIFASAQIEFSNNNQITQYRPGIRVKRIENYTSANAQPLITRYYYNLASKRFLNQDSNIETRNPIYYYKSFINSVCIDSDVAWSEMKPYTIKSHYITSKPINQLCQSESNRSNYQFVTVSYGGDNFEKGGKEMEFFVQLESGTRLIGLCDPSDYINSNEKYSNLSTYNGVLIRETSFSSRPTFNLNGSINTGKIKETNYIYNEVLEKRHFITNCVVAKITNKLAVTSPSDYSHYYFGDYSYYSFPRVLKKQMTKEFLSNGILETQIEYFYDSKLIGFPDRIIASTSKGDVLETKNTYTNNASALASIPVPNNYDVLFNKFCFDKPVQVEKFVNNQMINKERTLYNFNYLPIKIQFSKDNTQPFSDNIIVEGYNSFGNPTTISQNNGPKTKYVYNDKQQVILKIENFDATGIIDDGNPAPATGACYFQNLYPNSMVTSYEYDPVTGNLIKITDPKCQTTTYEYDSFNRLKTVKDHQGNTINENTYNYRPN